MIVNSHVIPYKNGFSVVKWLTKSAYIFLVPGSLFTLPWQDTDLTFSESLESISSMQRDLFLPQRI